MMGGKRSVSRRRELLFLPRFQGELIAWWRVHGRDFPWRHTQEPFRVLVAEVLLHRTRATQVVPVYLVFIRRFRSWRSVAGVSLSELRRVLRPLGLNWRIEEFHQMAKEVVDRFHGRTPRARDALESLPGVGHYKAAAVRCFAFDVPDTLLDTNTVRVLSRVRGLVRNDGSRRSRLYREEMSRLVDRRRPREFGFALLDLAALVCRPSDPECSRCPVVGHCVHGNDRLRCKDPE